MLVLGLEGTAHTFGAAVVRVASSGAVDVLSNVADMLRPETGGIHPREAAHHHADVGPRLLADALAQAGVRASQLDLVAFSQGPGLGPCLRTVATVARAFSLAAGKPLVGVNHCVAHLEIGRAAGIRQDVWPADAVPQAQDPVLLYASGGNTQVIAFTQGRYRVFGETLDVGVGNMLDKFAREEGHPFPGGPQIERLAANGATFLEMPYSVKGMDVSFSGLLTAARAHRARGETMEDVSFSLQETAFAMLVEVTERALAHTGKDEVVLGGGVACNERLWEMTHLMCEARGARAYRPEKKLLVDNGAMIALLGALQHRAGTRQTLEETVVDQRQRTDDVAVTWRSDAQASRDATGGDGPLHGAEAVVTRGSTMGRATVEKRRVVKAYRHARLDARLRERRTRAEARLLSEARRVGVRTPIVYGVDGATLTLERFDDPTLKRALHERPQEAPRLLAALGGAVAKLHARDLVHGDLTTSNVLVAHDGVVLIDFGLASLNAQDEDKGSDLHVLMEALEATHADLPEAFEHVLSGYRTAGGALTVERKVADIVQRGRYRGT